MDKTVPPAAALILDFIRKTEVGTSDRSGYDVIYGHKQHKLKVPLTRMTLDEIQAAQRNWSRHHGSSAAGGYQFMRATLRDLMTELGLRGSQKLDPDLQDRLGYHLLRRRGYAQFIAGTISRTEFGKRLAQEWASFPVLAPTQGQKRKVQRGQSFYAGDGLNKALVGPEAIEGLLDRAIAASQKAQEPPRDAQPTIPLPSIEPQPEASGRGSAGVFAAIIVALAAGAAWISTRVCDLIGLFCGG